MKKKTILLFSITMVIFFASVHVAPSVKLELVPEVQAATIGTHRIEFVYKAAYI